MSYARRDTSKDDDLDRPTKRKRPSSTDFFDKSQAEAEDEDNNGQPGRKEPLSLEEVVAKKREEDEKRSRPVFLTKEDRQQAALQRRQAEVAAQKAQQEAARAANGTQPGVAPPRLPPRPPNATNERDANLELNFKRVEEMRDPKVLEAIRIQYLGQKKQKKKVLKPSEKFKFSFDWDMNDDTSRDLNPLYQDRPDTALLFGRGRRAGIDLREQQQQNAFYEQLVAARLADQERLRKQEKKERKRQRAAEAAAAAAAAGERGNEEEEEDERSEDDED
jgi:ATP-dependent RNA helicase DDX23/PRP28